MSIRPWRRIPSRMTLTPLRCPTRSFRCVRLHPTFARRRGRVRWGRTAQARRALSGRKSKPREQHGRCAAPEYNTETEMADAHAKPQHDYHLVDPSPWPAVGSVRSEEHTSELQSREN